MANALPAHVKVCIAALTDADSDEEKITAMMFAAQQVKSEECSTEAKQILFKSIGADFLERMLVGKLEIPGADDCPKEVFSEAALTIVSCFCTDPIVAKSKEFLSLIPAVVQVLEGSQDNEDIKSECNQSLKFIAEDKSGRSVILSCGGFERLVDQYVKHESPDLLIALTSLMQGNGDNFTDGELKAADKLLDFLASEFAADQTAKKFKICPALGNILRSFSKGKLASSSAGNWPKDVRKGLNDILTSRIDDSMRDPALELASAMLDHFGVDWLSDSDSFRRILSHLASIEIRMNLEDRTFERIVKNCSLVVSCMNIVEVTSGGAEGDDAYSAAYAAVIGVLKDLSSGPRIRNGETTNFIFAMIRFLSFGYVHDILKPGDETGELIPFIIGVTKDSFYSYKEWFERNGRDDPTDGPVDMSSLMLPSLKKLFTIFECRQLMREHMRFFLDCLEFRWSLAFGSPNDRNSTNAVCNLLELFIAVINRQTPDDFKPLTKFYQRVQPEVASNSSRLDALVCVLGLVLLKHRLIPVNLDDPAVLGTVNNAVDLIVSDGSKAEENRDELEAEIRQLKCELKNLTDNCSELKIIVEQRLGPIGLGDSAA
ncbi:Neurochondrin [Nesidiocoris tenuis]|uniref:Neurochondrin n=1 Tax=Nesidiocoris tenuis TaxID=355587 RepID=A0ABN7BB15_9HEMI|nr:Neurochondrin [Nesidiocoris tenuis]